MSVSVAGCSDPSTPDELAFEETSTTSTVIDREVRLPTIRLGVAGWPAARLTARVAERVIERRLGYPVEQVPIVNVVDMMSDLEAGELHAVLEIWPRSLVDRERDYLTSGRVEDWGELGVEGRVGWYVPELFAAELGLEDWRSLADTDVAERFAGPRSEPGRGRLVGIDPSYDQFDEAIIDELGLPFEVEFSGSQSATEQAVGESLASGDPILIYWWIPTRLAARHDLVQVSLPEPEEPCGDDSASDRSFSSAGCAYRPERLIKLGSPRMEAVAPDVAATLRSMTLTTDDQMLMLADVDSGMTVDQAAEQWLADNENRWSSWLP